MCLEAKAAVPGQLQNKKWGYLPPSRPIQEKETKCLCGGTFFDWMEGLSGQGNRMAWLLLPWLRASQEHKRCIFIQSDIQTP